VAVGFATAAARAFWVSIRVVRRVDWSGWGVVVGAGMAGLCCSRMVAMNACCWLELGHEVPELGVACFLLFESVLDG